MEGLRGDSQGGSAHLRLDRPANRQTQGRPGRGAGFGQKPLRAPHPLPQGGRGQRKLDRLFRFRRRQNQAAHAAQGRSAGPIKHRLLLTAACFLTSTWVLAPDLAFLNFDIDKPAPGSQEAPSRLAEAIGEADPDLVALQNAWRLGDGSALPRLGLPYYGGRMRNGLIVLSRFPIIEERWQAFSCPMSRLRRSGLRQIDSGILLVRMQTPQGPVDAYNTRFIADEGAVQYRTLRMTQIFELASMVETYSAGKPFLILGDLGQDSDRRLLGNLLGLHHSLLPG